MRNFRFSYRFPWAFAAVLAAAVLAVSCSKSYKDIEIKDFKVEKLNISSIRSVDAVVLLEVDNPAVQKFQAENIWGVVYHEGKQIATFSSDDVIVLEAKTVTQSKIKVRLTLESPLGFLGKIAESGGVKFKDYTVDIGADIKSGIVKFPYSKKGMEVAELVKKADANIF